MTDDGLFRQVLSRYATGIAVMTVRGDDGEPHGMTANAVSSVSLDPLLVLVCVVRGTVMARLVQESGAFALSFLSADQEQLSNHFADASRPRGFEQFADIVTSDAATGSPILDGALSWVDCRVWRTHDGGDHDIVVGEVVDLGLGPDVDGLGYFHSRYVPLPHPD